MFLMNRRFVVWWLSFGVIICLVGLLLVLFFVFGEVRRGDLFEGSVWDSENRFADIFIDGKLGEGAVGFDLVFVFSEGSVVYYAEKKDGLIEFRCLDFGNASGELEYIKLIPVFADGVRGDVITEISADKIKKSDLVSDGQCERRTGGSSSGGGIDGGASGGLAGGGGLSLGGGSSSGGGSEGSGGGDGGEVKLINIAKLATLTSSPGGVFLERATDEVYGSRYSSLYHEYLPSQSFYFRFSEPQPIRKIRFTLPTTYYSILADTTGDGNYETELKKVEHRPGFLTWWFGATEWVFDEWSGGPIKVYGVKFYQPAIYIFEKNGSNGNPPSVGNMVYHWRTSGERRHRSGKIIDINNTHIWIHTSQGEGYTWENDGWLADSPEDSTNRWIYSSKPLYSAGGDVYEFEIYADKSELTPQTLDKVKNLYNPTLEEGVKPVSLGDVITIHSPIEEEEYLKGMYIEVWMMDLAGWIKSNPRGDLRDWPHYKKMVSKLKEINSNMVWLMPIRSGFEKGVYTGDWYGSEVLWPSNYIEKSSPENYLKIMADALRTDGIKLFAGDRPYPGWKAKAGIPEAEMWEGAVREMAESGIYGVAVEYDESRGNTTIRSAAADAAHAVNPEILTITNLFMRGYHTFAKDVDVDLFGSDSSAYLGIPEGHWNSGMKTEIFIGSNPNRRSINTLTTHHRPGNGYPLYTEIFPPVSFYGAALSIAFHGGEAMSYWRFSFHNNNFTYENVEKGYSMLDTLAAWGGKSAETNANILVLEAPRQAERFQYYNTVYKYLQPWPETVKIGYNNVVMIYYTLLKNGLPYNVRFVDYPEDFPDVSNIKVIILPLTYETNDWNTLFPQATVEYLQNAADKGIKIIVLNRGGTPNYSGYSNLTQSPNVEVIADDLSMGLIPQVENKILNQIFLGLGEDRPTYLNAYGNDIELASLRGTREHEGSSYLLLINWKNKSATVDVGINIPEGKYEVLMRNINEVRRVRIGEKYIFSKSDLEKFRVNLEPEEAMIFYIYPEKINIQSAQSYSFFSRITNVLTGKITGRVVSGEDEARRGDGLILLKAAAVVILAFLVVFLIFLMLFLVRRIRK
jgi:hypothetical protein